jgi:hypothetical protein
MFQRIQHLNPNSNEEEINLYKYLINQQEKQVSSWFGKNNLQLKIERQCPLQIDALPTSSLQQVVKKRTTFVERLSKPYYKSAFPTNDNEYYKKEDTLLEWTDSDTEDAMKEDS